MCFLYRSNGSIKQFLIPRFPRHSRQCRKTSNTFFHSGAPNRPTKHFSDDVAATNADSRFFTRAVLADFCSVPRLLCRFPSVHAVSLHRAPPHNLSKEVRVKALNTREHILRPQTKFPSWESTPRSPVSSIHSIHRRLLHCIASYLRIALHRTEAICSISA